MEWIPASSPDISESLDVEMWKRRLFPGLLLSFWQDRGPKSIFLQECGKSAAYYHRNSGVSWNILIYYEEDPVRLSGPRKMIAPMATPALSGMVAAVSACPQPMCAMRSLEHTLPNAARVLGCSVRKPSDLSTNTSRPSGHLETDAGIK